MSPTQPSGLQPEDRPVPFEPAVALDDTGSNDSGRVFVLDAQHQLLLLDGRVPHLDDLDDPNEAVPFEDRHLLGFSQGVAQWAAHVPSEAGGDEATAFVADGNLEWVNLRAAFGALPEHDWVLAGRASQILRWDAEHRFCGRCGSATSHHANDRARKCERCRLMAFPRLNPAVIMLVERSDGHALLAWGRQFPQRFYSALAGFVEPGESLEQTVVREVKEEVGVDVGNVRYFGSQPWPFPHSLMVGFQADYLDGNIVLQEEEICDAGWFAPDRLPPVPRGKMSIAGWLIEDWIQRTGS